MKKQLKPGDCYFQKVIKNENYKVFAFIRIDERDAAKSLEEGLLNMMKLLHNNEHIPR